MSGEYDWRRFPYESKLAIERNGVLVEQLEPGLSARRDGDVMRLYVRDGREVGEVHLAYLKSIDWNMLEAHLGDDEDALKAVREGRVFDDPTSSYITIDLAPNRWQNIHRSVVVEGWPEGDYWRDTEVR